MEKFGCTTPLGYNIDNICTDKERGKEAMKLYNTKMFGLIDKCPKPCEFMKISGTISKVLAGNKKNPPIFIHFDELVRVSHSYLTYTSLEMLAEVGGYVGLFLGVSVYHFKDLLSVMLTKLN